MNVHVSVYVHVYYAFRYEVSIGLSYYIYTMKAVGLRWILNFVP